MARLLNILSDPWASIERKLGREDFNFPGSWEILDLAPERADIVNLHNLHENYFDLRCLPALSKKVPLVITLHDAWLLSGHCAHSFECERWKTGCGHCPDLTIPPGISRDGTAFNWERKRKIYAQSRLYITTPSQWLMDKVQISMLNPAIRKSRVIPNGVDLNLYHPGDQLRARTELNISPTAKVLLFSAQDGAINKFKDFQTVEKAISLVAQQFPNQELKFISLGGTAKNRLIGNVTIEFLGFTRDYQQIARYYQAADVYIHAARAETFGLVIIEAMACGTPVVATAVGGIPEVLTDGQSGFLTPPQDPRAMAASILLLLKNEDLQNRMGKAASDEAQRKFSLKHQADEFIRWYGEVIEDWKDYQHHRPLIN